MYIGIELWRFTELPATHDWTQSTCIGRTLSTTRVGSTEFIAQWKHLAGEPTVSDYDCVVRHTDVGRLVSSAVRRTTVNTSLQWTK